MRWDGTSLGLALAVFLLLPAVAGPQLNPADPIAFFTNLASRLLKAEMNLDLTRIQIYPTNQYTPAVHRLLQVSANIYEATTNRFNDDYPHLPTVFRPRFTNDNGTVYICGYVEETNSAFLGNTLRDLISTNVANAVQPDDLIFGVPVVIGVKKGLPNFNEFSMETVFQITRKVELRKSGVGGGNMIYQTNQMFVIGISNVLGTEFWNSYLTNYPRSVDIFVTNYCAFSLTNDFGFTHKSNVVVWAVFSTNSWPEWKPTQTGEASSFIAFRSNHIVLPDSIYRFASTNFDLPTGTFERPSGYTFPRWGLTVTNRLIAGIVDRDTGQIVDLVLLNQMANHCPLSLAISQPWNAVGFAGVWSTNSPYFGYPFALSDLPGVRQQILVSGGEEWGFPPGNNWQNNGLNQSTGATRDQAIADFIAFFEPSHVHVYYTSDGHAYYGTNNSLVVNVPFAPTRKLSVPMMWQTRDPMVHYLSSDLLYLEKSGIVFQWAPPSITNSSIQNLARLNDRYQPWGANPFVPPADDPNAFNLQLKDPLLVDSEHWDFPSSALPSLAMLGRVHRGTPWQTLYLKSEDVSNPKTWRNWTGNLNVADANHSKPVRDWPLVALIASLINTNPPHALLSVNERDTNAWLAALEGITMLTNSASDQILIDYGTSQFDLLTMSSNSSQALTLENSIRSARAAQPNQFFQNAGNILAASALSVESPWLNRSSALQLRLGISDEAYEKIPAQLLARMRSDAVGMITRDGAGWRICFTGYEGWPYVLETSSNLVAWLPLATNLPIDGAFETWLPAGAESSFYRSVLQP